MLYFSADPRDGGMGGAASCNTCCCQPITMRPGETNLVQINYAPWVVPIGNGVQLLSQLDISFEVDSSACSTESIDGFPPPRHTFMTYSTTGAPVLFDLNDDAFQTPVGNTFQYRVKPGDGPRHGGISPNTTGFTSGDSFTYTPGGGFGGVDVVWFEQRDAQGRIFTFPVKFEVGAGGVYPPVISTINVDRTQIRVNQQTFVASFPLYMPPNIRECESARMLVRATARDCDGRVYTHYWCADIRAGRC